MALDSLDKALVEYPTNRKFISFASCWEIAISPDTFVRPQCGGRIFEPRTTPTTRTGENKTATWTIIKY
jgi:hypothetical protein